MYLIGIGTGKDVAVSDSVAMIRLSTNFHVEELHDPQRLEISHIEEFLLNGFGDLVIFVCHGKDIALLDVDRREVLTGINRKILSDKVVFAHACETAKHLGREIVASAKIYFGFDAPISAPVDHGSICFDDMRNIYSILLNFLNSAGSIGNNDKLIEECSKILDDIRSYSLYVQASFDVEDGSKLSADELIALNQFTKDAVIWLSKNDHPLKAVGAPIRSSLW
jgi:hypothetical protein